MKLLLVSATNKEIQSTIDFLQLFGKLIYQNKYIYKDLDINILVTGVGIMSTCFQLGKLSNETFDLAINIGICGTFDHSMTLGTIVHVTEDRFSDLGCENPDGSFSDIFEMNLISANQHPFKNGKLYCTASLKQFDTLQKVQGITVNKVTGSIKSIRNIFNKYKPDVESMEGAAFIFSCLHLSLPCIQIRAISNYVEERNKNNWKMTLAIDSINSFLISFISDLHKN